MRGITVAAVQRQNALPPRRGKGVRMLTKSTSRQSDETARKQKSSKSFSDLLLSPAVVGRTVFSFFMAYPADRQAGYATPLIACQQRRAGLSTAARCAPFILPARWLGWLCYPLSSNQQQPFLIKTNFSILYIGGKAGFFLSCKF